MAVLDIPDFIREAIEILIMLLGLIWAIIVYKLKPLVGELLASIIAAAGIVVFIVLWLIFAAPFTLIAVFIAVAIFFALLLWKIFGRKKK